METSTLYTLLMLVVPFIVALTVYGLLRSRDRSAVGSGCAAIVVGVIISFTITAIFILTTVS
jgi:hypothetical protein